MTYSDFYSDEQVQAMLERLQADGVKLKKWLPDSDSERIWRDDLKVLNLAIYKPATAGTFVNDEASRARLLLDVLRDEADDFYTFLFYRVKQNKPDTDFVLANDLILFALIRRWPDAFEQYFTLSYKTGKKMAKSVLGQYNEAFAGQHVENKI